MVKCWPYSMLQAWNERTLASESSKPSLKVADEAVAIDSERLGRL